jgi:hypothetical protein
MIIFGDASVVKYIELNHFSVGLFSCYIHVCSHDTKMQKITMHFFPIDSVATHATQAFVLSSCNGHIQLWDLDVNRQCAHLQQSPQSRINLSSQLSISHTHQRRCSQLSIDVDK